MEKESKRQRKLELDRAIGVKGRNREEDERVGPSLRYRKAVDRKKGTVLEKRRPLCVAVSSGFATTSTLVDEPGGEGNGDVGHHQDRSLTAKGQV